MEFPHVPLSHLTNFTGFPKLVESLPDTGGVIGADELELVTSSICACLDDCAACQEQTQQQIAASPAATALLHIFTMEACASMTQPVPATLKEAMLHRLLDMTPAQRRQPVLHGVRMIASTMCLRRAQS